MRRPLSGQQVCWVAHAREDAHAFCLVVLIEDRVRGGGFERGNERSV